MSELVHGEPGLKPGVGVGSEDPRALGFPLICADQDWGPTG